MMAALALKAAIWCFQYYTDKLLIFFTEKINLASHKPYLKKLDKS